MASHTDSPFVRATTERNSLRAIRSQSHDSPVEMARSRAQRAADYYHSTVLSGSGAGVDTHREFDLPFGDSTPQPQRDDYNFSDGRPERESRLSAHDPYYRDKLRQGFINIRNSYNEKHRKRHPVARALNTIPNVATAMAVGVPPEELRTPMSSQGKWQNAAASRDRHTDPQQMFRTERAHAMYKSNSNNSLDNMDQVQSLEEPPRAVANLRREYGSTSSLDYINTTDNNSFFQMLREYKPEAGDQRAPAPAQMKEYLRGSVEQGDDSEEASSPEQVPNGTVPIEQEPSSSEDPHSPKLKSKSQRHRDRKSRGKSAVSESSTGILRRLIGSKSDPTEAVSKPADGSVDQDRPEDKQKRKAFVHYDCQSIGIGIQDILKKRKSSQTRRNTSTGASAASVTRSDVTDLGSEGNDPGDGRSNDLVLSCPFFRNEIGGEEETSISLNKTTAQRRVQQLLGNKVSSTQTVRRSAACNGVSVLDTSSSPHGSSHPPMLSNNGLVLEYVDSGAYYYRDFFNEMDHQNYFGTDENLGPIAISIRREKVVERETSTGKPEGGGGLYQYRLIVRTSELPTLRGCILEDAIPSSARLSNTRGLPHKDVLEFVLPELQISCLKQGALGVKTWEQLAKLDEQRISKTYKIGIMYCKAGQSSEEEMYNNERPSRAFDEFLDILGQRVKLKGFSKYLGGLDSKTDSSGTHSLYTNFYGYEIMFHVSTLLPFTSNNKQQLMRKRHIGNDIVTIVFQEEGALPFTPKTVRSHFQHVFIIVRVHNPNSDNVRYSVAVSRSKDVPPFGPAFPEGAAFPKSVEFAEFLLTKAINAENAAHQSEKFSAMATRTRQEYLKDLSNNYVSATALDSGSKLSKFHLGSGRKKEKTRSRTIPDMFARGAVVWNVQVEDFSQSEDVACLLGIAAETIVLIDEENRNVIFTVACRSVLGWTSQLNSLRIYYDRGECVVVKTSNNDVDEVQEMISRLSVVTQGCEAVELTLRRSGQPHLGFQIHSEGIVAEVDMYSAAWQAGLRTGSRVVEICQEAVATLTHDQMVDLLRGSPTIKIMVIPPHDDSSPRRGVEEARPAYLSILAPGSAPQPPARSFESRPVQSLEAQLGASPGSNYLDVRAVTARVEAAYDQPGKHLKQASQDSGNSRSSGHGSLDGHTEGQRTLYGDGFSSGRHYFRSNKSWISSQPTSDMSQEMRMQTYALYGKDLSASHSKRSPSNTLETPKRPSSNSLSNLSQHSDWSSSKSSTSSGPRQGLRSQYGNEERRGRSNTTEADDVPPPIPPPPEEDLALRNSIESQRGLTRHHMSSSLRRQQSPTPPIDRKPSPVSAHRNLGPSLSDESTPGWSKPPKPTRTVQAKLLPSRSVQEDLRKLLNPDISFGDDTDKEESADSLYGKSNPVLHRTLSDESLVGRGQQKAGKQQAMDHYGDVIFTSAIPAQMAALRADVDNKLSPRAVQESSLFVPRGTNGLAASSPSLPLPESGTRMDWSDLVKTATRAMDEENGNLVKRDKDHNFLERVRNRPSPIPPSEEKRSSYIEPSTVSSSVAELETRCEHLEEELKRERQRRVEAEAEIRRLQEDNVRLQEESQTAAAQLRRFTEWFFNTIDKQ